MDPITHSGYISPGEKGLALYRKGAFGIGPDQTHSSPSWAGHGPR
jgi:hypothetical protein